MSANRPEESRSQEIGKRADRAMSSRLPNSWIDTELTGDSDYGLDYLIQVKDAKSQVSANFYLQLKGTESPAYIEDKKFISQKFKSKTLNLYRDTEPAVMVAVVDLSVSDKVWECPTYYLWLDEDFLDSIADRREENDEVTIRVPVSQLITEDLDVLPYYLDRLSKRERLIGLHRAVERFSASPEQDIFALTEAIERKPVLLEAIKDDAGAPWIDNPEDKVAGKLKTIFDTISTGKALNAQKLLAEFESIEGLTDHERAELVSLKGMLCSRMGQGDEAERYFKEAYSVFAERRYKVRYYESLFRLDKELSSEELSEIARDLNESNYQECALKAKCLALLGDEDAALAVLEKHEPSQVIIPKLIIFTITGDFSRFDDLVAGVDLESLKPRQKYLFHIMVGRRFFYEGIKYDCKQDLGPSGIPHSGKEEYDFGLLKDALGHISTALDLAQDLGYPSDCILIFDVGQALYSFFGQEVELIERLDEVFKFRGGDRDIRIILASLKFSLQKYSSVVDLLVGPNELSAEEVALKIFANYHLHKKREVIQLVDKFKNYILQECPKNYESIFCVAAICARDILDSDKEKDYLEIVRGFDNGQELLAIYDYIQHSNEHPEQRKDFNRCLYEAYLRLGRPISIALQIFSRLDVNDSEESEWICELADKISECRSLDLDESAILAFALSSQEKWGELEELCEKIKATRGGDSFWALIKANAVDSQGRSSEALEILDSSLNEDKRSIERAENFVNLSVRLGFFQKAQEKLEELLENSDSKKQLSILELLLFLYSSDSNSLQKLSKALVRYGEINDRNDEQSEGKYLLLFLLLTSRDDLDVSGYVEDFQDRLSRFIDRYPNSKLLRQARIPENAGPEEIVKEMRTLAGIGEEDIAKQNKYRLQLRNNKLPIPYSLLSKVLIDVGDLFSAWVMSRYFKERKSEYLVRHSIENIDCEPAEIANTYTNVIIDEVSLLTLWEIGLLEKVIDNLPGIVIERSVYDMFARSSHPVMGSIYCSIPRKIVDILGAKLSRITLMAGDNSQSTVEAYQEVLERCEKPVLYSDDLYLSELVGFRKEKISVINSITLTGFLFSKGVLSPEERVRVIEGLCDCGFYSLNLPVDQVIDTLSYHFSTLSSGDILDTDFYKVFNEVFSPRKDAKQAFKELCYIFSGFLNVSGGNVNLLHLKSLLTVWLVRYQLFPKPVFLSIWFVQCCLMADRVLESELTRRSLGHANLWNLFVSSISDSGPAIKLNDMLLYISRSIMNLDPENASDAFDAVCLAFIEGGQERALFSEIYTRVSIAHRLNERNR